MENKKSKKFVLKIAATIRYFQKKCNYQLAKKYSQICVHSIIMVKLGDRETAKERFYSAKRPIKTWKVSVDNIVFPNFLIQKLILSI